MSSPPAVPAARGALWSRGMSVRSGPAVRATWGGRALWLHEQTFDVGFRVVSILARCPVCDVQSERQTWRDHPGERRPTFRLVCPACGSNSDVADVMVSLRHEPPHDVQERPQDQ